MAKIYENTNLTVTARIENHDVKAIEEVTFKFQKDGEQFEEKIIPISEGQNTGVHTVMSHTVMTPAVADDKDLYLLDYTYTYKIKDKADAAASVQTFPSTRIEVFPRHAQLKVTDSEDKAFPNFEFVVEQNGDQSPVRKTFAADTVNAKGETVPAGSCEFNLELFPGFRIVPSAPYDITEEVVATGRKREVKGAVGFRAVFAAPRGTNLRQFVNYEVEAQGQTGTGHAVTVEVGVHPDDIPFLKPGQVCEVHFRATFGPDSSGAVAKSTRNDTSYPTKVLKVSEADTSATIEEKTANTKYQGKITLVGGNGKFVLALGRAGGDTCKVEIAGSDKFLNEESIPPDAILTIENWRRVYYELMVPDIMFDRALELTGKDPGRNWNFRRAVVQNLESAGRQLFIEFVCARVIPFNARKYADHGTLMPGRFLGTPGLEGATAYVLSGRNWKRLPTGQGWRREHPGKTLYIHVCDAILKWRTGTSDEKAGTVDFSSSLTEASGFVNMLEKFSGHFLPFSGYDAADGIEDVAWTADISKDDSVCKCTPTLTIEEHRTKRKSGSSATIKLETTPEKFVLIASQANLDESQTKQIQEFIDRCLEDKSALGGAGGKVTIRITGTENTGRDEDISFNAVKNKLKELFAASAKEFIYHPGLNDDGEPRSGSLSLREVTDVLKSTTKEWHFQLPLKDRRGGPGPGAFVGSAKTPATCPILIECRVQPHIASAGEAQGKVLAWVSDPEDGPRQLVRVVMKAFNGTKDDACVAHTHGDKGFPGDCLLEGAALCDGCIKHVRSRNLTNIL